MKKLILLGVVLPIVVLSLIAVGLNKKLSEVDRLKEKNAEMAAEMTRANSSSTSGKYPLTEVQSLKLQIALKEAILAKHKLDSLAESIRTENKIPASAQFDEMQLQFKDPVQVKVEEKSAAGKP